ncbi:hypothetical protein OEA41_001068 [Lepraria neglecta]|uniref:WD40 repeat-like protein n=1 Tax=Lepraria neglecta TaxID=209136 RepID=A0AAE0DQD0_9LECA|nr:hypothetical protein OEA41_001068 [Lepraria neglecta]
MSMITASLWVPRGAAAAFPTKYDVDENELARISKLAKLQLEDAEEDLDHAKQGRQGATETEDSDMEDSGVKLPQSQADADDDLKEYDLEHYDSDTNVRDGETMAMFGNARSLAYHKSNADDPYITMQENDEEDEEREDLQILATDNMIVAAKVEDEVAHLEIYVYEDEAENLYVHHDIMLPAIPLCVEWLDLPVGKDANAVNSDSRVNFVAVGTFDPDIEIWDLDTIDCMYPNAILGQDGEETKGDVNQELKKKKKRKKSKKANDDYHVDAVLSLAANRQHRNLLASSSADKTVKLWDLNNLKCAKSYSYHTDKACSIAWHPRESTMLLSGSYDRTVVAADMRAPDAKAPRWGVESDVEMATWDPHDPNYFYITTENGIIHNNDIRNAPAAPEASKAVWTLQAHDESISSFDVNPAIPGFLVTGSTDKTVKLWNVQSSGPSMVVSRNVEVGKVFTTRFAPDPEVAFRLAVAGSKGTMQVWDTSTNAAVRRAFATRMTPSNGEVKEERIVGVEEDSSDSEKEGGVESAAADATAENGWESMDDDLP